MARLCANFVIRAAGSRHNKSKGDQHKCLFHNYRYHFSSRDAVIVVSCYQDACRVAQSTHEVKKPYTQNHQRTIHLKAPTTKGQVSLCVHLCRPLSGVRICVARWSERTPPPATPSWMNEQAKSAKRASLASRSAMEVIRRGESSAGMPRQ